MLMAESEKERWTVGAVMRSRDGALLLEVRSKERSMSENDVF